MTAAYAVVKAVREGRLLQARTQTCRACGKRAGVWHHPSYADGMQLHVVAVCDSCHVLIHRGERVDPSTGHLWCKICRSSMGCDRVHSPEEAPKPTRQRRRKLSPRFTDDEIEQICGAASAAGVPLARWIRTRLLTGS